MSKTNNQAMFIKTKDEETHNKLLQEGFELVDYVNGTWTFVNNTKSPLTFENNKVVYSNILCI